MWSHSLQLNKFCISVVMTSVPLRVPKQNPITHNTRKLTNGEDNNKLKAAILHRSGNYLKFEETPRKF